MGGLGIYSASDVINYAFLASRLQTSSLQAKILANCAISSPGPTFERALGFFRVLCGSNALSLNDEPAAPQMMKQLAGAYFNVVEKSLASTYKLTPRHVAILSSTREPHAQDFLFTVPIEGLGQKMNHRQYRSVLCYRLAIPLFAEGSICPSCNNPKMDKWGDHAVHCSNEIGVKFRHNLVRDMLVDICCKAGISVRKEVPLGFYSEEGKDLRPADLLLYNWLHGKDACVDVTGSSPFAGTGVTSWVPRASLANAVERKRKKYTAKCEENGYKFIPFAFSTFGELGEDALDLLSRIGSFSLSNSGSTKSRAYIFQRLAFCIQKGVGAQLVARLPTNFL